MPACVVSGWKTDETHLDILKAPQPVLPAARNLAQMQEMKRQRYRPVLDNSLERCELHTGLVLAMSLYKRGEERELGTLPGCCVQGGSEDRDRATH